jgi:Icc-related predicted phosphoesterase
MKILAVSDQRLPEMEQQSYLRQTYSDVALIVSCGDIDASYLEFIASTLNRPLFYVRGNHDTQYAADPPGGENLHLNFQKYQSITMVGLEGSPHYNGRNVQYRESEMTANAIRLLPTLLVRRLRFGFGVDYLVTHAPPRGIHDRPDVTHRGFTSFLWFMRWARPKYLIHGHIDVWDRREVTETQYFSTRVINIDPKRLLLPHEDYHRPLA